MTKIVANLLRLVANKIDPPKKNYNSSSNTIPFTSPRLEELPSIVRPVTSINSKGTRAYSIGVYL